jgi:hypothetical protein
MRIEFAIGGRSGGFIVLCRRQLLLDRFEIYEADQARQRGCHFGLVSNQAPGTTGARCYGKIVVA